MERVVEIIPLPDSIGWNVIHEILYKAHEINRQKGIFMRTANLSGEELKERVGTTGQCFVALVDGSVAGTSSVKIVNRNAWYHKGPIGDFILSGVLPEYKGLGLYDKLTDARVEFVKRNGVSVIELDTAEGNSLMQSISLKHGFRYVAVKASPYTKHYSVVMAKWLGDAPFCDFYCKIRYQLQSILYKLRYKRGHIKRFGV